ncbi:hypothetical protein [Streptomyces sp. NPDC058861]|uniref:hypothetical protein n=1 Tax=Streptomyces sp. NPDC058861 TaxID=3346653 RepID=UPI00369FF6F8
MNPPSAADTLTDHITQQLGQLSTHLSQAGPQEAARLLERALVSEDGIFNGVLDLVISGGVAAQRYAEDGHFPSEVWLALGRTANALGGLATDTLAEQQEALRQIASRPAVDAPAAARATAPALVVRGRHR